MILSEFKTILNNTEYLEFKLENGESVPAHFHITEVGEIQKNFIDCGGVIRKEKSINFQLYTAEDIDHRLKSNKLLSIIKLSEDKLDLGNYPIEVEYQANTIGKYGLEYDGQALLLKSKQTDCLAKDNCGIPEKKEKVALSSLHEKKEACCDPSSGCC